MDFFQTPWPLPSKRRVVRVVNYKFVTEPLRTWSNPPPPEPEDYPYIVQVELTEIPSDYPLMYDPRRGGHSKWTIVSEYRISEFPVDRFFLVECWAEHVGWENNIFEATRWSLYFGAPTLGIGNREIPFELPEVTWNWLDFVTAAAMGVGLPDAKDKSLKPSDMDVMTAIFRLKDWNPRRPKVE